jgi:dihydrofolate reductase
MSPEPPGRHQGMPLITAHLSISLDGFVAGPDQSEQNPIGVGGMELHRWHLGEPRNEADRRMSERVMAPRGAYVMGRNMFGPIRGDWGDSDWQGWWGDEPPYHAPVFVLTHHERKPVELNGTTFFFVDGFDAALEQAVAAAGDGTVTIAGGASAVRQGLQKGVVDEILLSHVPVLLGSGERLFDGVPALRAEPINVAASPLATHVVYAIHRP